MSADPAFSLAVGFLGIKYVFLGIKYVFSTGLAQWIEWVECWPTD